MKVPPDPVQSDCSVLSGNVPIRHGKLKYGNPSGNPANAPRCGAKTRAGTPCRGPAVRGKRRCRMHGGTNPGPPRGNRNGWVHGRRSRAAVEARKERVAKTRSIMRDLAAWELAMRAAGGEQLAPAQEVEARALLERLMREG